MDFIFENRLRHFYYSPNFDRFLNFCYYLAIMNNKEAAVTSIINLVRESSLSRLKTVSGFDDILVTEFSNEPLVFAHWMSFILISGKVLRIVFKAHFTTESAKFFAAKTFQTFKENVSQIQAFDFIKEYCNVTAGQIKVTLANNNVKMGFSLPGMTRGFDEVFYESQTGSIKNYWRLDCRGEEINCSANIEVFDNFVLNNIAESKKSNQGDVEYL
jgi:hypothetical protein